MSIRSTMLGAVMLGLASWAGAAPAAAQNAPAPPAPQSAPDPAALAAAKELVKTMRLTDQFRAMLPNILQAVKPIVAQNRAEVQRDLDMLTPVLLDGMTSNVDALADQMAEVYARNFSVAEIRDLATFYHTPTGQRLLDKTPVITQQSLAVGQAWGQKIAAELQTRMTEELKKRGKL